MTKATEAALYRAWQASGASDKVRLALFETAIVESGVRNLASRAVPESLKYPHEGVAAGDHDSVGVLQQRASWGSVQSRMNVEDSARRFINKAKRMEKGSGQTAGQLAQAVQVSAFPGRYDAVMLRAVAIIKRLESTQPTQTQPKNQGDNSYAPDGNGAQDVDMSELSKVLQNLANPQMWQRFGLFIGGFILTLIALAKLTGDNQLSSTTKTAVKIAARVVTKK